MPIPSLLALLSASAAVRFGRVIISLNAQIFLKSFRKKFENSTLPNYSLVRKRFWQMVTNEAWLPLRSALPLGAKKIKESTIITQVLSIIYGNYLLVQAQRLLP